MSILTYRSLSLYPQTKGSLWSLCVEYLSLTLPNVICKRVTIKALIGLVMNYMSEHERRLRDLSLILRYGKDICLGHLMS
jgi:hypothetical protein